MELPNDWQPMTAVAAQQINERPVALSMGTTDFLALVEARMVLNGRSADDIRAVLERLP
jgi:hypothetical protein